jgi:GntR family transcriptional regulator
MERNVEIRISPDSPEPVVKQIAAQLRLLLVEGRLKPGDWLPSARRLATDLAVHFNTVAEAYRVLAGEGWLDVSHGRSARVLPRQAPAADERTVVAYREKLRHILAEMKASGVSNARIRKELMHAVEVLER